MKPKMVYCEHGAVTSCLKRLQRERVIELVHFPYDPNSRSKRVTPSALPSEAQWRDANMRWNEKGALTWNDSKGSDKFDEILAIVGRNNRRDTLHVDSAHKSGCVCFITNDADILDHADELNRILGIPFFKPDRDEIEMDAFLRRAQDASPTGPEG